MMIISIAIQKGGSGKTTTAINLGAALRDRGHSVLLLDLDPQANLTQAMGFKEGDLAENIYHVLKNEAYGEATGVNINTILKEVEGMALAPAGLELAQAELELVSIFGRELILAEVLSKLERSFEFILIDCPPSIGMLTVNALVASNGYLMPLQSEFFPLNGVKSFLKFVQDKIQKKLNPAIELYGFVLIKHDPRITMHREVQGALQQLEHYEGRVFEAFIRPNIALAKAQEANKDIFLFQKNANGAADYRQLATEFLQKIAAA
ncbi:MAG: ParA family protein [Saprospiraceae bacterium]|nr:ParA family protein [Saprospiraceae bacterium]